MKVLIADSGTEPDDFATGIPGELVMEAITCDRDRLGEGNPCGCGRAWVGLSSRKVTSVARVVDRDLDLETLASLIADALTRSGWKDVTRWAQEAAEDVAECAAEFPEAARLRRNVDEVTAE